MKKLLFILCANLLFASSGAAVTFAQAKCFENGGLKDSSKTEFVVTGGKVSGWFHYLPPDDYEGENSEDYSLSGTRAGNILTVKFADGKRPKFMPRGASWVWQLIPTKAGGEILRINFYGQNYETKKYSIYPVDFDSCKSNLASRDDTKRVNFVRGASSAKMPVSANKQAFLINIRKGQFVGAIAFGYSVTIYYPNGDVYAFAEEDKAIKDQTSNLDFNSADASPTDGDALVLVEKAPDGNGEVIFIVKNTKQELETAVEKIITDR